MIDWVEPDWPYQDRLRVLTTTRVGGRSGGPFAGFNLAVHVGDDPEAVTANRGYLETLLGGLPVQWLTQVHGTGVIEARPASALEAPMADAAWTALPNQVVAVLTADCLPVVLADRAGTQVAVVHGGWRGLVGGVLESTCSALPVHPEIAWLGPAIGPDAYEVGEEVVEAVHALPVRVNQALRPGRAPGKAQLDLFALATGLLDALGVAEVYSSRTCVHSNDAFYSYRRDGQTGRMATLAWLRG